jgi:hypothetical protein
MPKNGAVPKRRGKFSVFLNIPYDAQFIKLYLAYIAGTVAFGLEPHATLEIPGGARRLDRIFELIQACRYSIHDLSRVQLDRKAPITPRFNMPFELGMAVAWEKLGNKHTWFVCEAVERRILKSLSDLNGSDVYVHDGSVRGVFRELCNAFKRTTGQPTVQQMEAVYRDLRITLPQIMRQAGAKSPFTARVFSDVCVRARAVHRLNIV